MTKTSVAFRRPGRTVIDLCDSANLYLTTLQGHWYEQVLADPMYQKSVTSPLTHAAESLPYLLRSVATTKRDQPFTVVDCGPATAEESIRKLRALQNFITIGRYVVIDINSRLLTNVKRGVASQAGLQVTAIRQRFEEVTSETLRAHASGKVLLLFGSTGMNYERVALLRLMRRLCFPGNFVSMESVLRDGARPSPGPYESEAVARFAFGPLWHRGAKREDFQYRSVPAEDRVRIEFIAKRDLTLGRPRKLRLRRGDSVWTAFSRRPTISEHQEELAQLARRFDTFIWHNKVAASVAQIK